MSERDKWGVSRDDRRSQLRRAANNVGSFARTPQIGTSKHVTSSNLPSVSAVASQSNCPRCGGYVGGRWSEDTSCFICGWVPPYDADQEFDFMASLLEDIEARGYATGPFRRR